MSLLLFSYHETEVCIGRAGNNNNNNNNDERDHKEEGRNCMEPKH